MVNCNKCRRAPAVDPDTWCLACRGVEVLTGELAGTWPYTAARVLAEDAVVSAVRTVKGLRSLGTSLSSAEHSRAAARERTRERSPRGRASSGKSLPPPPPPPAPLTAPKEEYSYAEESEEEEDQVVDPPITTKAKCDPSKPPPEPPEPPREHDRDRSRGRRRRGEASGTRKHKKRTRGGKKHQRLHRQLDRPDLPLPRRPPRSFWEERPSFDGHRGHSSRR